MVEWRAREAVVPGRSGIVFWIDGRLVADEQARVDVRDRGFTLGDGLFETIRVRRGQPLLLDWHLARLRASAATIRLALPWRDEDVAAAVESTLTANDLTDPRGSSDEAGTAERTGVAVGNGLATSDGSSDAVVRLSLSRGVATTRGLPIDPAAAPSLVIHAQPFAGYPTALYERGMRAVVSRIRRNEHSPLSRLKSLSYLDNVLARQGAVDAGADEALLLNTSGVLACASAANLFLVIDDVLVTPGLDSGVLPGTRRRLIVESLAPRLGLAVVERNIQPRELAEASEAFLSNALLGVMALVAVDGSAIGEGRPGPVTARVGKAMVAHLRSARTWP